MFKGSCSSIGSNLLESFYRQYVSLLLIVLVFSTVGIGEGHNSTSSGLQKGAESVPLTDLELENPFSEDGISSDTHETLRAARQILRSHDVSLFITLNMPTQKYGKNRIELDQALRYLRLIGKQFFEQPEGVVTYSLVESAERKAVLSLRFTVEGEQNA